MNEQMVFLFLLCTHKDGIPISFDVLTLGANLKGVSKIPVIKINHILMKYCLKINMYAKKEKNHNFM